MTNKELKRKTARVIKGKSGTVISGGVESPIKNWKAAMVDLRPIQCGICGRKITLPQRPS